MKEKKRKQQGAILAVLLIGLLMVLIGPLDVFRHGFYADLVEYEEVETSTFYKDLAKKDYEQVFTPLSRYFQGFQILLSNLQKGDAGELVLTVDNARGELVDQVSVDISKLTSEAWYPVYLHEQLEKGQTYTLRIHEESCPGEPWLVLVNKPYLASESVSGNLLIGYAYVKSTFTFEEKVILLGFLFCLCLAVIRPVFSKQKTRERLWRAACLGALAFVLTWTYQYNSFDTANEDFQGFQADSEALVTGPILSERKGISLNRFGLGRYYDTAGKLFHYDYYEDWDTAFLVSVNYDHGYSKLQPQICISNNIYTLRVCQVGNRVRFVNGQEYEIVSSETRGTSLLLNLDAQEPLSWGEYGSLADIRLVDPQGQELPSGYLQIYDSSVGLQGKVFRHLARYVTEGEVLTRLHLLPSLLAAFVFVGMVGLLERKYNRLLAGCFYVTFWLSPWVVNFGRNLYWLIGLWFLPMLIGLFCSLSIEERKYRILSYLGIFCVVFGKCLCSYEYLSAIFIAMVAFLTADFLVEAFRKHTKKALLLFRTIVIMGMVAVAAFLAALLIHGLVIGQGNLSQGLRTIWEEMVLRRTFGGALENFDDAMVWESLNASMWETFRMYFHFSTEIIAGIPGNLFPVLCILPLGIFWYNFKKETLEVRDVCLYGLFFLAVASWLVLAKSHSYIHTHINFILWYFGYIQMCFYIIVKQAADAYGTCVKGKKERK